MRARAWIHLHTELSGDADLTHEEVRRAAAGHGVAIVFLTEHQEALGSGDAARAVARCREVSDEAVLLVPGLEVACDEGCHLLGLGLAEPAPPGPVAEVAGRMGASGAYPVLAHPSRCPPGWWKALAGIGAVEVWNRHYDGRLAPDPAALAATRRAPGVRALFGLDAHGPEALAGSLPEVLLDIDGPSSVGALAALREGRFETGIEGRPFEPGVGVRGLARSVAGEAYRLVRRSARRISYALHIPAKVRRRWGKRW